jgi:T4 RnlA family RNA ligase
MVSTIEIYNDLMALCSKNDAFFYNDFSLNGQTYRVFDYRLASYTDWLNPSALECRGITFQVNDNGEMIKCASRPFRKFFNFKECPFTMNLNLDSIVSIQAKMDGSLITTMKIPGGFYLKSKGSLFSPQAIAANELINTPKFKHLRQFVSDCAFWGFTVCMEYTAPNNRIVIGYTEPNLTLLAIRNNETGDYMDLREAARANGHQVVNFCVDEIVGKVDDKAAFIESIKTMQGIEGFVCHMADGLSFKVKTDAYTALHKLKDSINSVPQLFECVLTGASDDLRSAYYDDEVAIQQINKMETFVTTLYNETVRYIEDTFNKNKHLDRKEFAIQCKEEMPSHLFGLVMNLYLGRKNDYVEFFIKNRIQYGITQDKF